MRTITRRKHSRRMKGGRCSVRKHLVKSGRMARVYHGTTEEKFNDILTQGILPSGWVPANEFTKTQGFEQDSKGVVSFAKKKKDAVMFANFATNYNVESVPTAVIEVETDDLPRTSAFQSRDHRTGEREPILKAKDLFGKKNAELQYVGVVPPSAMKRVTIRRWDKAAKKMVEDERVL